MTFVTVHDKREERKRQSERGTIGNGTGHL